MWYLTTDHIPPHVEVLDAFTPDECDAITKIQGTKGVAGFIQDGSTVIDEDVRKSNISWLMPSPESEWVFRRLTDVALGVNKEVFKFDLSAFLEAIQFGEYESDGGHYSWHVDSSQGIYPRKLSISVQLSPPDSYEGGDLELHVGSIETASRSQGSVILFPSYRLHRVTPVTQGVRHSLVAWIAGPAFR